MDSEALYEATIHLSAALEGLTTLMATVLPTDALKPVEEELSAARRALAATEQ